MTTATKTQPPAEIEKPCAVLFQGMVAIENIIVGDNIRKHFNPVKLAELTESVRLKGVDTPVLLRPADKPGFYFLVAGARRLRASKAVGLAEIPAIVKDMTAQQAAESQAIENIQREDLDPIDEARGFKVLTQPGKDGNAKYTVDDLRQRLGKSLNYVYRALALLELPQEAIAAIEDGRLTPAHGLQILRVPPAERVKLVDLVLSIEGMTATDLRYRLDTQIGNDLASAHFPKGAPYAGKSACSTCPSNTGNQGVLFDGAEKGNCMNKPCFTAKTKQYKTDFLEKLRLDHLDAAFVEYASGYIYSGQMRAGGYIAKAEFDTKKPPKGTYGLMVASNFDIWVAVPDKKAKEVMEEREAPKPTDPKDAFIEAAIRDAMYAAAGTAAKKLKIERKDWVQMAIAATNDLPQKLYAAVLGVDPEECSDGDFEKAPEATLRAVVLLNQRLSYSPGDAEFKKLGVDVAKVKKQAASDAKVEWDNTWGLKHKSVANGGSEVACGLKGLSYDKATENGIAVPTVEEATCPQCKVAVKGAAAKPAKARK